MSEQIFSGTAAANIALIKYMGKSDPASNRPSNASLSVTLPHLCTHVELRTLVNGSRDVWGPRPHPVATDSDWRAHRWSEKSHFRDENWNTPRLSQKGIERFLNHVQRVRERWHSLHPGKAAVPISFSVSSWNNFPSDCGIASSASSFAALTTALIHAFSFLSDERPPKVDVASEWSREGSGSSCRSFYAPWSLWKNAFAEPVPILDSFLRLRHQLIIVDQEQKAVSSSDAHTRVTSSLLNHGRSERAQLRLNELLQCLSRGDAESWNRASDIVWSEFWDMHALFETSAPAFGYMTSGSMSVLEKLRNLSTDSQRRPLVTMDAGPNVHIIWHGESDRDADHLALLLQSSIPNIQIVEQTLGSGI